MCAGAGTSAGGSTSVGIRLSVKSSNQKGISAHGFFAAGSSLPSNTEPEDELDAALCYPDARVAASGPNDSGDGVAEDELLSELTDDPGTTRGTKLSVLQIRLSPFLVTRGS